MIELEKVYLNSKLAKDSNYFSKITKNGLPLDSNVRYSFEETSAKATLLERTFPSDTTTKNSVVKFLFRIDEYETNILGRHSTFGLQKKSFEFSEQIPKIKKDIKTGNFLIGCVLKQVKGGFTVDLGGLVCFMPYSLSEGTRFSPYSPDVNTTQLFQSFGLSLVITPEKEVFLNLIVSRKNNAKLLKGLIKKFLKKGFSDLDYLIPEKGVVKKRKKQFRLVSSLVKSKGIKKNNLRVVREISFFDNQ